ncbi:MAG TPA: AMIN domain-containing protein, partial [Candidatus Aquilonibacter sp.]|nr:AMIN domain-containing protein [Candidatus Aquilonibacter sp.]
MAVVTDIRLVHDHAGAAIQIASTRPVVPTIESKDAPPRLIVDLPNTRSGMQHNRIDVLQENILTIRTEERPAEHVSEHQEKAPFLRIVVSFLVPYGYAWEAEGNSVIVRLKPPEDPYVASRREEAQRPQAAALKPTVPAAVVPVTSGVGDVLMADRRFAAGSSITAGSQTAVLQLARGGDVRVCPGTTVSVTPSKSTKDLMIGLSTGAMETHYELATSADTILTPDFRILLAGPGEFNYAISSDSKGTTCVRGLPGNASSAIVSELIG